MTDLKVLVLMPAWNEAAAIGDTIKELRATLPEMDLLVIDDGSTDDTVSIARAAGATVVQLPYHLGVGGAMRMGYKYAFRYGYDRAIQVDSDGQHDPGNIRSVLAGLDEADISIGARFADKGTYVVTGPRKWAMTFLARVVSHLAGTRLTDITSGFRAGNRTAMAQYSEHYPIEYLGDTVDSLVVAIRSGLSVTQVPVEMRPRRAGKPSNNPWKASVYLGRAILALLVAMTRSRVKNRKTIAE